MESLWELVLVCVGVAVKRRMYQRKIDVDMLDAVKSVLANVSSVSPSSEQSKLIVFAKQRFLEAWQNIGNSTQQRATLKNAVYI